MIVLGADPGQGGGIAVLDPSNPDKAFKMPETLADLRELLAPFTDTSCVCYLEAVSSSPQMGVTSAFKFGKNYGHIEAGIIFSKIRLERVAPQTWQKALRCLSGGDKNVTKMKAQELFPQLKITHAIADALLIAEFGRRKELGIL